MMRLKAGTEWIGTLAEGGESSAISCAVETSIREVADGTEYDWPNCMITTKLGRSASEVEGLQKVE
jgi:hypothetical protein